MVKKTTLFEASDGKQFKTKTGALNHERKLLVNKTIENFKMSKEEIAEALLKTSKHNNAISFWLNSEPDWTKWDAHKLSLLKEDTLKDPKKTTKYVLKGGTYLNFKEKELVKEVGEDFGEPEKHLLMDGKYDEYVLVEVQEVNEFERKVIYDLKYTPSEVAKMKLKDGVLLSSHEIESIACSFEEVYEEVGSKGRWDEERVTVVEIDGKNYAIEWSKGLTEMQEDFFHTQPYEVVLETKEVVVQKTFITKVEK